ncbi:hypothetical protein GCM10022199_20760 [Marihabitans asiaticum]
MTVTSTNARRPDQPALTRRAALLLGSAGIVGVAAACSDGSDGPDIPFVGDDTSTDGAQPSEEISWPVTAPGDPAAAAVAVSAALIASSPAAVVVGPDAADEVLTEAGEAAVAAGVPCFVDSPDLGGELERLGVERVRLFPATTAGSSETTSETSSGSASSSASGESAWSEAVSALEQVDSLPEVERDDTRRVVVTTPDEAAFGAAVATVRAVLGAGEGTTVVQASDPREDEAVEALRAERETSLVAVGDSDTLTGDALAGAATMAAAAQTLPTGGILPLGGERRMIALYGHPGVAGLGLLGEQDLDTSIERVKGLVGDYASIDDSQFMPAFEVIVTIADSAAGEDGNYSTEGDPQMYRPWVDAAKEAGVYVLLDLQPGYTDFVTQAKIYEELLAEPHVGLALDPEWRLEPGQRHMEQIGHVEIEEVNETAAWLAELTRSKGLPQKVFMLHQFQLQMLRDRDQLRTDLPEIVTVIHADGHGTPDLKQGTWGAIKADLPDGVLLGWKNFIDEDKPTFTPQRTMTEVDPKPRFVSYQ